LNIKSEIDEKSSIFIRHYATGSAAEMKPDISIFLLSKEYISKGSGGMETQTKTS
jgi:hypothetical protein